MAFKIAKNISVTNTTDLSAVFYNWKQQAVLAGWQVLSSGTGSSGTGSGVYNASGDSISSAAILTNTNAWFRIRMPTINGVRREFLFQKSGANNNFNIAYSYDSFTYGFTSGGSAGTAPTAGDQMYLNLNTAFTPASDQTSFDLNCFVCVADGYNGDGYNSYLIGLKTTDKTCYFHMFFDFMQDGSYPVGSNVDNLVFSCSSVTGSYNYPLTPYYIGLSNSTVTMYQYGSGQLWNVYYYSLATSDGNNLPQYGNSSNYGGIDTYLPIVAKNTGGQPNGTKGVSTLLRFTTSTLSSGDTLTVTNNKDRIVIDQVILPWDGSNPIL
jgi:hypothetical protein